MLIDDLSKNLLKLEFKSNLSIKLKCLNELLKKYFPIIKNEKHTVKNKANKNWKKTFCLQCKHITHNFRPPEVKMINKVLREKLNCIVCRSNKSRFSKQKLNNKNKFNTLLISVIKNLL